MRGQRVQYRLTAKGWATLEPATGPPGQCQACGAVVRWHCGDRRWWNGGAPHRCSS